ncbi:DUF6541 family protein [Rothia sp. HC945]|uniref:DUF6541 family protein n=1 Tax=Rothia sp. HC945 TaxID=3171170 RepID=UPI003F269672
MVWTHIVAPVLVGLAVVFFPGFLFGLALRLPLRFCATYAPIFSIGSIVVASVISGQLGWHWGFAPYIILSLTFIAVAGLVSYLLMKRHPVQDRGPSGTSLGAGLLGLAIAATTIVGQLKKSLIHPDAISQSFDNIFHLNGVRWIGQTGNGSSLSLGAMTTSDGSDAFYPGGWHDLVYLVFSVFPGSIPVATNATTIVVAAFVWPLSVLALALTLKPADRIFVAAATGLSGATVAFPSLLLKWGVLYPNLLGYAILPAFLAMLISTVRIVVHRGWRSWWPVVPSLLVGASGIILAHPNALTSAALLIFPLVLIQLVRSITGKFDGPRLLPSVLLGLAGLMCVAIWWKVRPAPETSTWQPKYSDVDALGQFVSNGFNRNPAEWGLSMLVLVGIFWTLRSKDHRWIVGSWLLLCWFWVIVASEPAGSYRLLMVGPWYADEIRLAALTAIPVVVLAAFGASHLVRIGVFALRHFGVPQRGLVRATTAVGLVFVLTSAFVIGKSGPMAKAAASTAHEFKVTPGSILITTDEEKVLDHVDQIVPKDDTIIVNPWEGSAVAYALNDRNVTSKHSLSQSSQNYEAILQHLNKAQLDPKVCQEVRDQKAWWYLEFEDTLDIGSDSKDMYKGLEDVDSTGTVKPVYTSGSVGLYKVSACD